MDLNHGSTGYEPVGISGRPAVPDVFLTTLPRCGADERLPVFEGARAAGPKRGTGAPWRSRSSDLLVSRRPGVPYLPSPPDGGLEDPRPVQSGTTGPRESSMSPRWALSWRFHASVRLSGSERN